MAEENIEINEASEMRDDESSWQTLKNHEDYEINTNYPHQIKRKATNQINKEWIDKTNGYLHVSLNGKGYSKHRLISIQFISNPDNLPQVDHINHIKTDNRIENLRWVSAQKTNQYTMESNILFLKHYQKQLKL